MSAQARLTGCKGREGGAQPGCIFGGRCARELQKQRESRPGRICKKLMSILESECLKSTFSRTKFNSGASVILCNDLIVSVLTMRMLAPDPSRNYPRSNPPGRQRTNIQHFTLKTICTGTKILMGYRRTAILMEDAPVCHFDRPEGAEESAWRTMQIPRLRAAPSARDEHTRGHLCG